jgi:hypothetical protein
MADSRPAVVEQPSEHAQAFLRLADLHLDAAYRLARAILHDATDAQDATHDAFERAWRKWSTLRDPSRFEPWFDRILVTRCSACAALGAAQDGPPALAQRALPGRAHAVFPRRLPAAPHATPRRASRRWACGPGR